MNFMDRAIFIISADSAVAQGCVDELAVFGGMHRTQVSSSIEEARTRFLRLRPTVVFLDESAIEPSPDGESLESAVASLIDSAPVVVAAAPEKEGHLGFLITSG